MHLGWAKPRGEKDWFASADPKPRCGKGYKVPEIKPALSWKLILCCLPALLLQKLLLGKYLLFFFKVSYKLKKQTPDPK